MRSAKMDNLKGFLIICVVLGHLLELQEGNLTNYLYLVIYSFHMPLFAWVCGYFAKPANQKSLKTLLLPYVVFQLIYSAASVYLWDMEDEILLLEPYWLMWFILSLFLWRLLLPLVDTKDRKQQGLVLAGTVILSILVGRQSELRYVLSFQRTVALFPIFLLGYYGKGWKNTLVGRWQKLLPVERGLYRAMLLTVVVGGLILLYLARESVNYRWLYWKYPYGKRGGTAAFRVQLLLTAILSLGLALSVLPENALPVLTRLGQNTMPVYLLHGFVQKTLEWRGVYEKVSQPWLLTAAVLTLTVLLFSSPPVARLFERCFGGGSKRTKGERCEKG